MNKRSKAIVLALFFGGVGVHKFYLDQPIRGMFYLLFCWTFIPAIIAIIDIIYYLLLGDEKFDKKFC